MSSGERKKTPQGSVFKSRAKTNLFTTWRPSGDPSGLAPRFPRGRHSVFQTLAFPEILTVKSYQPKLFLRSKMICNWSFPDPALSTSFFKPAFLYALSTTSMVCEVVSRFVICNSISPVSLLFFSFKRTYSATMSTAGSLALPLNSR